MQVCILTQQLQKESGCLFAELEQIKLASLHIPQLANSGF